MAIKKISNSLDTCEEKKEIKTYCDPSIGKIMTSDGITSIPIKVAELSGIPKTNVHMRAYVDFYGGYAEHGRNVLFGLGNRGDFNVKLTPIRSLIDIDPFKLQETNRFIHPPNFDIEKSILLTIAGPGWAQEKFQSKTRYNIIWTMTESKECHPDFKKWLENVDEVWVPTSADLKRFNKIHNNVRIMRLGIDNVLYQKQKSVKINNIPDKNFVFGFIGSWNKRKGIKQIIRAFCSAFSSFDPVTLLLISKYGTRPYDGIKDGEEVKKIDMEKWDIKYEFERYTKEFKDKPQILLIDIPLHENIIPNFMSRMNCLVGCSMGESTWLPGLQAFSMRILVIQLENPFAGYADYMDEKNSWLVKPESEVVADEELVKGTSSYYDGMEFMMGNEENLVNMLRDVFYTESEEVNESIKIGEAFSTVRKWTWSHAIENVAARLKEIDSGNTSVQR